MPATSTAGDLFARRGLLKNRRRRRQYTHPGVVPAATAEPNDLWTSDFKGHFRTGDGVYCYPLTVADQHTRFLFGCQGLLSTQGHGVRPIFELLFREYGLPRTIRTDNGGTVCYHRHPRIVPAQRVVDPVGHSASAAVDVIENRGAEDLDIRKVYRVLEDRAAAETGYLRVIDESGEDYLYPAGYFVFVDLPGKAKRALTGSLPPARRR